MELPEIYKAAEKWIVENRLKPGWSNWITFDIKGESTFYTKQGCHAWLGASLNTLKNEPAVHGEKFAAWEKLGDAGQRYFSWLCDNQRSLFGKWSDGDISPVIHEDKIIGALWKNMDADARIVGQWIFAGRCAGEHKRATSWDHMVQGGVHPFLAFWGMHFLSYESGMFSRSPVSHIGIVYEDTLRRVVSRDPNLARKSSSSFGCDPGSFKSRPGNPMYSNYIWRDKAKAWTTLFKPSEIPSGFGAIQMQGFDMQSVKDGFKRIEDEGITVDG